jgi:hypothetical protein
MLNELGERKGFWPKFIYVKMKNPNALMKKAHEFHHNVKVTQTSKHPIKQVSNSISSDHITYTRDATQYGPALQIVVRIWDLRQDLNLPNIFTSSHNFLVGSTRVSTLTGANSYVPQTSEPPHLMYGEIRDPTISVNISADDVSLPRVMERLGDDEGRARARQLAGMMTTLALRRDFDQMTYDDRGSYLGQWPSVDEAEYWRFIQTNSKTPGVHRPRVARQMLLRLLRHHWGSLRLFLHRLTLLIA